VYVAAALVLLYALALGAGLDRGVSAIAGGEPNPLYALGGIVFVALRLAVVTVAPVLVLGTLVWEVVTHVAKTRRPSA
jgi:hypothetical protein